MDFRAYYTTCYVIPAYKARKGFSFSITELSVLDAPAAEPQSDSCNCLTLSSLDPGRTEIFSWLLEVKIKKKKLKHMW